MHIALDITEEDMDNLYDIDKLNAVKVLGFRENAGPLHSEIKNKSSIRMVTKLADYQPEDPEHDMILQTTKADMLYRMICMNKFDTELPTPYEEQIRII